VRVAFLIQDLQLSGGVGVIVAHAAQLSRKGFEVDLVLTRDTALPEWSHHGLASARVLPLAEARGRYDIALATWWETAEHLHELDAARHACFVQSLEDRFYPDGSPWRTAAGLALDRPVRFVTEARWIADTLERLYPGEKVLYVRNGIAKDVFAPVPSVPVAKGELRVLIEGSARVPFKGVAEALAATGAMAAPRYVTVVAPDGSGAEIPGADRIAGPLTQRELAALYSDSDVLLKLSRVEGMFGPPLEAFHRGATCVVTPVSGHDEYIVHGENGLVVDWDDTAGTARALDTLASDRALLHRLRSGALATARSWPSWEQQGQVMAAALLALRREPPPDPKTAARRLSRDLAGAQADGERVAAALENARSRAASAEASRFYRAAVKGRTTVERVVRAPDTWRKKRRGEL
jgi:O-antigen biosynthesis protein